jgi:hypothetical protein
VWLFVAAIVAAALVGLILLGPFGLAVAIPVLRRPSHRSPNAARFEEVCCGGHECQAVPNIRGEPASGSDHGAGAGGWMQQRG